MEAVSLEGFRAPKTVRMVDGALLRHEHVTGRGNGRSCPGENAYPDPNFRSQVASIGNS